MQKENKIQKWKEKYQCYISCSYITKRYGWCGFFWQGFTQFTSPFLFSRLTSPVIESQDGWRWQGPLGPSNPLRTVCPWPHPDVFLKISKWRDSTPSGPAVPELNHPHKAEIFSDAQRKSALFEIAPIAFCSVMDTTEKEPGSVLIEPPSSINRHWSDLPRDFSRLNSPSFPSLSS